MSVGIVKGQDAHYAEVRDRTVGVPSGNQVRSETLGRLSVNCAKREIVDPTALEHRPGSRRRDRSEDFLVEKRETVEVAREKGGVIHA